jgi:hypothetical protein
MREFSKVSPTVWRSKKFRSLPDMEARHVYLYLLTCPHANSAGCFDIHPLYAAADTGLPEDRFRYCMDTLSKAGLIEWDDAENTVLIGNWVEFNGPQNPKHALGILSQLSQVSSHHLRAKAYQELRDEISRKKFDREGAIRKAMETFCEPYGDGIATRLRQDGDIDKTETRQDETRLETREEVSRPPLRAVAALPGDGLAASGAERLLNTTLMRRTA